MKFPFAFESKSRLFWNREDGAKVALGKEPEEEEWERLELARQKKTEICQSSKNWKVELPALWNS